MTLVSLGWSRAFEHDFVPSAAAGSEPTRVAVDTRAGSTAIDPGCAVHAAAAGGRLPAAWLGSHLKLQRELAHLERRRGPRLRQEERAGRRRVDRELRRSVR